MCFTFTEVVVSPPFVFLPVVKSLLRPDFHVSAQNCWVRKGGAYTGEVRYVTCFFFNIFHLVKCSAFSYFLANDLVIFIRFG